jgi:hypothetical protein
MRVSQLFPSAVAQLASEALRTLTEVADGWVAAMDGHGPPDHDPRELLDDAATRIAGFQAQARDVVQKARAGAGQSSETQRDP